MFRNDEIKRIWEKKIKANIPLHFELGGGDYIGVGLYPE